MLLNNTGITLKPKFYFIILKFVTRGVCGYLDGPCCLLTTTGAAQRNAQSTVQPRHPSPQNPKNFKVDFRKKYGSYGALDRPKFLRKLCSFVRSYLRPWGPKTLGSEKSTNPPCWEHLFAERPFCLRCRSATKVAKNKKRGRIFVVHQGNCFARPCSSRLERNAGVGTGSHFSATPTPTRPRAPQKRKPATTRSPPPLL